MKIAFDYQIFSNQNYGGISRYFIELAKNMPRVIDSSINLKIISPLYINNYLKENILNRNKIGFPFKESKNFNNFSEIPNYLISKIYLHFFEPDILHETYYSQKILGSKSTKRIITVYDMIHELYHEQFPKSDKTVEHKKLALKRADHIICISRNTQKDLIKIQNIDINKTSVVHLGFSFKTEQKNFKVAGIKPFILFVGLRSGYKNFSNFVKAYSSSKLIYNNFKIVCFGGGKFDKEEMRLFEDFKISNDLIVQLSGDDIILKKYYSNASVFIYPSLYEGFGIPPLEAMACGCAVVCSNSSSLPEVVGDAAYLFDPTSIESIKYALEMTLFNNDVREKLILKGFKRINFFSWEKCAKDTYEIYKKVK